MKSAFWLAVSGLVALVGALVSGSGPPPGAVTPSAFPGGAVEPQRFLAGEFTPKPR